MINRLIKDINKGRCILMLGPRLSHIPYKYRPLEEEDSYLNFFTHDDKGNQVLKPLIDWLPIKLSKELEQGSFIEEEITNLSYIAQKYLEIPNTVRIDLEDDITDFYAEYSDDVPLIYQQLAKLPFDLIINTAPDDYMTKALEKTTKKPQERYYHFRKPNERKNNQEEREELKITVQTPLIYNLFGSLSDMESLVITEEDQINFIRNVVKGNPSIDNKILSKFDGNKTYLFLGFNLNEWHLRLLLDSLQLDKTNRTFSPKIEQLKELNKEFYMKHFKFNFFNENIEDYVSELFQRGSMPTTNQALGKIAVIFAEKDREIVKELMKYLKHLEGTYVSSVWSRLDNLGGDDVQATTIKEIQDAKYILPLLSVDLGLESYSKAELALAFEKKSSSSKTIIPIYARDCPIDETDYSQMTILPKNRKPIKGKDFWASEDEAFQKILDQLKEVINGNEY